MRERDASSKAKIMFGDFKLLRLRLVGCDVPRVNGKRFTIDGGSRTHSLYFAPDMHHTTPSGLDAMSEAIVSTNSTISH